MKTFHYSVPLTPPIVKFVADAKAVEGSLSGGFQGLVNEVLSRQVDVRLYLDDRLMGRAWRYSRTFVGGGWQDTHLPPFMREIERLLREHKHRREQPDAHLDRGLFPGGEESG